MKGTVLGYDKEAGEGVIRGEDGRRYSFAGKEWKAERAPRGGIEVDFEACDGRAEAIYPLSVGMDLSSVADSVAGLARNENLRRAGHMAQGLFHEWSFSRSPVGIGAAACYVLALFLTAFSISMGMIEVKFSLISTEAGKLALVAGIACAAFFGVGRKDLARLAALLALVLPVVSIYGGSPEFSGRLFSHNVDYMDILDRGLTVGFYLSVISALVMLFSPVRRVEA